MRQLTAKEIVAELDRHIIGQHNAKRAVAVALRNRQRRRALPPEIREEVVPKNIILIGPTGVGKTEIARRLARLVSAPFIKVEASKFTEVGYVGRDVESMARELVETAVRQVKRERETVVQEQARRQAEARIARSLDPSRRPERSRSPLETLFGGRSLDADLSAERGEAEKETEDRQAILLQKVRRMELEEAKLEIEVEERAVPAMGFPPGMGLEELGSNLQDMLGSFLPRRRKKRWVTVAEARRLWTQEEAEKLVDMDEVVREALERAEQDGIIFLDEIDKIATREGGAGPDVSRGGVQRDILPVVEGCTVTTRYGPVKTDHVLFIAGGAFHTCKPSDLIPELQGRFPIRVELESLGKEDLCQILTKPENSLIKQYSALLSTEGIKLQFSGDAIAEIAEIAYTVNAQTENIGARRLHTIMEKLLEDVLYEAPELPEREVTVDAVYVRAKLIDVVENRDLARFIL